jgi:hypothetical protein
MDWGKRRRDDKHQAFHHSGWLVGEDELVRLDAQVGIRIAHVRLDSDNAFNDGGRGLIIRRARGQCGLLKVRLREAEVGSA